MNISNFQYPSGRLMLLMLIALAMFTVALAQSSRVASLTREIKAEFPERQKQIAEKCEGAEVLVDVDFASFGDNYDVLLKVPQQGLKETANGFRRFCTNSERTTESDPDKVSAVKAKVKKVLLRNVAKPAQKKVSLQDDGTVLIEMAFGNISGGLSLVEIQRELGKIL